LRREFPKNPNPKNIIKYLTRIKEIIINHPLIISENINPEEFLIDFIEYGIGDHNGILLTFLLCPEVYIENGCLVKDLKPLIKKSLYRKNVICSEKKPCLINESGGRACTKNKPCFTNAFRIKKNNPSVKTILLNQINYDLKKMFKINIKKFIREDKYSENDVLYSGTGVELAFKVLCFFKIIELEKNSIVPPRLGRDILDCANRKARSYSFVIKRKHYK
jgi:hypothetical protein